MAVTVATGRIDNRTIPWILNGKTCTSNRKPLPIIRKDQPRASSRKLNYSIIYYSSPSEVENRESGYLCLCRSLRAGLRLTTVADWRMRKEYRNDQGLFCPQIEDAVKISTGICSVVLVFCHSSSFVTLRLFRFLRLLIIASYTWRHGAHTSATTANTTHILCISLNPDSAPCPCLNPQKHPVWYSGFLDCRNPSDSGLGCEVRMHVR